MRQQFDSPELLVRAGEVAKEIRKSDAFPALIGGLAGGLAGALVAAIIVGRAAPRSSNEAASDPKDTHGGWALRDVMQLLTVGATLAKQVQMWMKEQEKK
jgi:hypothetical protein